MVILNHNHRNTQGRLLLVTDAHHVRFANLLADDECWINTRQINNVVLLIIAESDQLLNISRLCILSQLAIS